MDATSKGARMGREYIRAVDPKITTVSQIGSMARVCAREYYKTEGKQQEFVKGWQASTQEFFPLFLGSTQRTIRGVMLRCEKCSVEVEIEWECAVSIQDVRDEQRKTCPVCGE